MATIEITDDNFREVYSTNDIVVLDFWAAWCGPCQSFGPVFERVSEDFPGAVFGKVDTEAQQKLSAYFSIRSIPTIMIIREETELFRHSGSLGEAELREIVTQVQQADMNEVRAKIEAEEAQKG